MINKANFKLFCICVKVSSVPTVLAIKNGKQVGKFIGLRDDENAIEYLKFKAGYKKLLNSTTQKSKETKEMDKKIDKIVRKCVKIITKHDSKPITYTKLIQKLEKEVSSKKYSNDIQTCVDHLRSELENETLIMYLKNGSEYANMDIPIVLITPANNFTDIAVNEKAEASVQSSIGHKASSLDNINEDITHEPVIKRYPSLTWREANERARILFYKGKMPSIRYNENRDSFRVSMIRTEGQETPTEVPVLDEDVRRLLNSCGLYWNGESISLLNKSDEIFNNAQQEAFELIQLINNNNNKQPSE